MVSSAAGGVVIRSAVPADWPVLQDIEIAAGRQFRDVGLPEIADSDPPRDEELAGAVALLVAVDDTGALVGYARIELLDDHAHLEQLSVLPEVQGQGVGTQLLDAVAAWARELGHEEVTLTTFRDVPFNAPLYARRGFVEVPEAEWTGELRSLLAEEASHGLDPLLRVVMRRRLA
jgi:GNAT superfamily N-acetyltransferase